MTFWVFFAAAVSIASAAHGSDRSALIFSHGRIAGTHEFRLSQKSSAGDRELMVHRVAHTYSTGDVSFQQVEVFSDFPRSAGTWVFAINEFQDLAQWYLTPLSGGLPAMGFLRSQRYTAIGRLADQLVVVAEKKGSANAIDFYQMRSVKTLPLLAPGVFDSAVYGEIGAVQGAAQGVQNGFVQLGLLTDKGFFRVEIPHPMVPGVPPFSVLNSVRFQKGQLLQLASGRVAKVGRVVSHLADADHVWIGLEGKLMSGRKISFAVYENFKDPSKNIQVDLGFQQRPSNLRGLGRFGAADIEFIEIDPVNSDLLVRYGEDLVRVPARAGQAAHIETAGFFATRQSGAQISSGDIFALSSRNRIASPDQEMTNEVRRLARELEADLRDGRSGEEFPPMGTQEDFIRILNVDPKLRGKLTSLLSKARFSAKWPSFAGDLEFFFGVEVGRGGAGQQIFILSPGQTQSQRAKMFTLLDLARATWRLKKLANPCGARF